MWILTAVALALSVSLGHAEVCSERTIEGKYVVITGAAKGIGRATAECFLAEGARLVVLVDKNKELGLKTTEYLKSIYGDDKAHFIHANVNTDLESARKTAVESWGYPDVLINNAGLIDEKYPEEMIATNFVAMIKWSKSMLNDTRKDHGGNGSTIINMSDMYAYVKDSFMAVFKGTSAGIKSCTETMGHPFRYKTTQVRMITVCPGFTNTTMTEGQMEIDQYADAFYKYSHSWKWQSPEQVAAAIVKIFKEADTGTTYTIDGGEYFISPDSEYFSKEYIEQYE